MKLAEEEFGYSDQNPDNITWDEYKKFKEKSGRKADYKYYCKHYGKDKKTIPLPENEPIVELIYKYLGLYKDGMGGINSHGLLLSFDLEGINKRVRPIYTTKLIAYLTEISKQQNDDVKTYKEPKDGKECQDRSNSKR